MNASPQCDSEIGTDLVIGREIIRLASIGSTMDEVARLAANGAEEGVVVVAEEQTAGRGRGGRTWTSPPGSSLLMSVLLRPVVPVERLSSLSLVAGVAVAEALERFGVTPKLKWPNDVWLDGRKVAGVLVNSRVGPDGMTVVLGIGININVDPADLPLGAASLGVAVEKTVTRDDVLQAVLTRLNAAYSAFTNSAGRPDLDGWSRRAALVGERVQVSDGPARHSGEMLGIDGDGALLLRSATGEIVQVIAGDLTRGPRTAAAND